MEKLLEYVYLGQTTVTKGQRSALEELCGTIGFDLKLPQGTPSFSSESDVVEGTSEMSVDSTTSDEKRTTSDEKRTTSDEKTTERKSAGPLSIKKKKHDSEDLQRKKHDSEDLQRKKHDSEDLQKKKISSTNGKTSDHDQKPKDKVNKNDKSVRSFEDAMKSLDEKKVEKPKNVAVNPLFKGSKSSGSERPTSQKRRLTEETEKSDSKKMRTDGSSSEVDGVSKRKQEALAEHSSSKLTEAGVSTGSDIKTESPAPAKKRIGPRPGAKKIAPSAEATPKREALPVNTKSLTDDLYVTEEIESCRECNAIFLSKRALDNHVRDVHSAAADRDDAGEKKTAKNRLSSSSSLSSSSDEEEEKRSPSPSVKKKTPAKIKTERRQSKRSSSSDSDSDSPPRKPVSKTASSSAKKPSTPRADRASLDCGGERACRFCPEKFDKAQNLKNHVLNHFKAQLLSQLPLTKPFDCPICQAPSRDKITLMRHYGFTVS
jgi:hypothetical protein